MLPQLLALLVPILGAAGSVIVLIDTHHPTVAICGLFMLAFNIVGFILNARDHWTWFNWVFGVNLVAAAIYLIAGFPQFMALSTP